MIVDYKQHQDHNVDSYRCQPFVIWQKWKMEENKRKLGQAIKKNTKIKISKNDKYEITMFSFGSIRYHKSEKIITKWMFTKQDMARSEVSPTPLVPPPLHSWFPRWLSRLLVQILEKKKGKLSNNNTESARERP